MKLIDTHAHLQFERFDSDREEVVKRSSEQLLFVINPGASLESSQSGVEMVQKIDNFYAAVGLHPHHVDQWKKETLDKFEELVKNPKVVAIGEVGLDNHIYTGYPEPNIKKQIEILLPQIELALSNNKPILFHCRKAYDELYDTIKGYKDLRGLMHCFMGDKETAKKFVDLGLLISFAGNLTYPDNSNMRETAAYLNNDFILIETDSPYLSPEGLRGTRNEPINVRFVAQTISEIKKISFEKVTEFTVSNSRKLFKI